MLLDITNSSYLTVLSYLYISKDILVLFFSEFNNFFHEFVVMMMEKGVARMAVTIMKSSVFVCNS